MKTKLIVVFALLSAASLGAAPLAAPTAVHSRPDAAAPIISVLNAGSEPPPAADTPAPLPAGWTAIELSSPLEAFVHYKDLLKSNDVRAGAKFYQAPKIDSPVIATMEKGDPVEVIGLSGKWTQVRLLKKRTGYINVAANTPAPAVAAQPAKSPAPSAPLPPPAPAPVAPAAYSAGGAGRPAQMVNLGDGGSSALPRVFEGKIVSTRRLLTPRRPYDYQLNDSGGQRYAYLDLTRLLQTEQLDKYIDHTVAVYGTAKPVPDTKDIVIVVESLQLR